MNALQGIAISGDGTKFYATRSTSGAVGETIEYTMSTPFDLSTLSADRTVTAASTGNFSGGFVMDIFVSPDKSKLVIMSLGGDASNGYQTILDEWPLTAGNITPISGSTDRKTKNVSNSLGNTYDASGDDSNVYSQGANFHPNGEVLVVVGVLMDDSPTNSSNQCHITRWTT